MNYLRRYSQAALLVTLAYGLAAPTSVKAHRFAEVKPEKIWQGFVPDQDLLAKTPPPAFIADANAFAALWKAWKLDGNVPDVDFKNEVVVLMAQRRTTFAFMKAGIGDEGNFVWTARTKDSEGPGFGYIIFSVKRDGIVSIGEKRLDGKKFVAKPPPRSLKAEKTWSGTVMDPELLKQKDPQFGSYITDAKAFEELWKGWKLGEKVPEVDFKSEIVLFVANCTTMATINATLDDKGDLSWYWTRSLDESKAGFSYMIISVKKDGIKSVKGKPLKE